MVKKAFMATFIILLFSIGTQAYATSNIEIFDIEKGCVVKNVESSPMIQNEVTQYLKGICGFFGKLKPIPPKGFMVKIFLEPEVLINSPFLNTKVNAAIIIFPKNERPYLMVLDGNKSPAFFYFKGSSDNLLKLLNYDPKFSDI